MTQKILELFKSRITEKNLELLMNEIDTALTMSNDSSSFTYDGYTYYGVYSPMYFFECTTCGNKQNSKPKFCPNLQTVKGKHEYIHNRVFNHPDYRSIPISDIIDKELVLACISTESAFDFNAKNDKNSNGSIDYGLMQLNSGSYDSIYRLGKNGANEEIAVENLKWQVNLRYGILHLVNCIKNSGFVAGKMGYNAGENTVIEGRLSYASIKGGGRPDGYIEKIWTFYKIYKGWI